MSKEDTIADLKAKISFYEKQLETHRAAREATRKKLPMSAEVVDSNPYR